MIDGEHFDEESLIQFAEDCVDQDSHPHLVECADCRSTFEQYRSLLASFSDESTWDGHPLDETPNPETIANLRSFADRMKREDTEADPLVAELLAGPREEWMPRLMADAKYRTAGVVRRLIAAMPTLLQSSPADALLLTEACVNLTKAFSDSLESEIACTLLGGAWRERAYALFYAGDVKAASDATAASEAAFEQARASEYDLARVRLISAQLLRQLDYVDTALSLCERAEDVFRTHGDVRRVAMSRSVRAYVLSKKLAFREASEITRETLREFESALSQHELATLTMNYGYYERELGRLNSALEQMQLAGFMFENIGSRAEAARMRWNVAAILRAAGDTASAKCRLEQVVADFESLGMVGTAAVASLDLAEILLESGQFDLVDQLCRRSLEHFATAGLSYSARAMTAIAYLKECCDSRVATGAIAVRVKSYLRELPTNPDLLFASALDPQ